MKRLLFSLVLAPVLVLAPLAEAKTLNWTAKIYDLKDRAKLMFESQNEYEVTGDTKTAVTTVKDTEGNVVVVETTTLKIVDGKEILTGYQVDQKQLETTGKIEVKDGKANFTFTKDGKTKNDDEKFDGEFVVTSTIIPFLTANWDKIVKGETLKVRLGVVDRMETVGFQYFKEKEKEIQGGKGIVVKMKASSLVISAIVNPLFFGFSADGSKLLELEGRTSAKVKDGSKWKDFDGFTVYTHAPPPAAATPAPDAKAEPKKAPKKKK